MSRGGDSATHGAAATTSKKVAPVSRTAFSTSDKASVMWAPRKQRAKRASRVRGQAPPITPSRCASQAIETMPRVFVAPNPGSVHCPRPARDIFSDARTCDPDAWSFAFAGTGPNYGLSRGGTRQHAQQGFRPPMAHETRTIVSHKGQCFCGAVHVEVTGEPDAMGYCHCGSCRSWSGGPVNAFSLWKPDAVKVTVGAEHVATFQKTPMSHRRYCAECGGHLMTRPSNARSCRRLRRDAADAQVRARGARELRRDRPADARWPAQAEGFPGRVRRLGRDNRRMIRTHHHPRQGGIEQ